MNKNETLKDGTAVVIRDLKLDDLEKLMAFYKTLPPDDRRYLKVDVTARDVVRRRILLTEQGNVDRLIALVGDNIVADGMLEVSRDDWSRHQGELRVIVDRAFRRRGLGLLMMRELHSLAVGRNIRKVVAKFMRPQEDARRICRALGFREESLLPDYVLDRTGAAQDLVIMTADIQEFWKEIESFYRATDWQRCQ
ncbi:MAG: GNAT family N-acetyltransferase [Candidatus Aminicenantes bacterium]|nr:GNAT family N-acetyltransferase [Candidatus Aminicenantes bacterium]